MNPNDTKWWGWGNPEKTYHLENRPHFWPHLRKKLSFPETPVSSAPDMEEIEILPCSIREPILQEIEKILPSDQIAAGSHDRIMQTYGKSYYDLIRIRRKIFPEIPDAILYPKNEKEIRGILEWAAQHSIAVVPRGGGSSVVGGVESSHSGHFHGLIVLNLKNMNRLLSIRKSSLLADAEAGIFGPELEQRLQKEGLTLAHYPESFEFSSLGGWIAARSAGQQSTLYGKMEDMVESLQLITPTGIFRTPGFPSTATGPDIKRMMIGSEGILGVISQASVRLKPLPEKKFYTTTLFRSFDDGIEASRLIMRSGIRPATLRLSDAEETDFIFSLREKNESFLKNVTETVGFNLFERKDFKPGKRSLLILGLEGSGKEVDTDWKTIRNLMKPFPVFQLGQGPADSWYRNRFENPYLRDILLDYNILVDTLETAAEWEKIPALYSDVRAAILQSFSDIGIQGIVTAHLSHTYSTGSSLYFILLAVPHQNHEIEEWQHIKKAASDAIAAAGGTISHHHGIGLMHKPWLRNELGEEGIRWLRMLKQAADPDGILNPGKLLPD
ncbi:MAG: FAD-binding oxidoreductase [Calditrichia bacterium]